jgi:hypothetical protein
MAYQMPNIRATNEAKIISLLGCVGLAVCLYCSALVQGGELLGDYYAPSHGIRLMFSDPLAHGDTFRGKR